MDERTHCPICDTALVTQFLSNRKQKIKIEDNKFVVVFVLKSLGTNKQDYEVGYAFNPADNTFSIEFYSEWDTRDFVPLHLIEKFREFHNNVLSTTSGIGRFIRKCTFCNRYVKFSTNFNIDFKNYKLDTLFWDGLQVASESFGLSLQTENDYKIIHLNNYHLPNSESKIVWFRSNDKNDSRLDWMIPSKHLEVTVPLIKFISYEETAKRINNLLTFA